MVCRYGNNRSGQTSFHADLTPLFAIDSKLAKNIAFPCSCAGGIGLPWLYSYRNPSAGHCPPRPLFPSFPAIGLQVWGRLLPAGHTVWEIQGPNDGRVQEGPPMRTWGLQLVT